MLRILRNLIGQAIHHSPNLLIKSEHFCLQFAVEALEPESQVRLCRHLRQPWREAIEQVDPHLVGDHLQAASLVALADLDHGISVFVKRPRPLDDVINLGADGGRFGLPFHFGQILPYRGPVPAAPDLPHDDIEGDALVVAGQRGRGGFRITPVMQGDRVPFHVEARPARYRLPYECRRASRAGVPP